MSGDWVDRANHYGNMLKLRKKERVNALRDRTPQLKDGVPALQAGSKCEVVDLHGIADRSEVLAVADDRGGQIPITLMDNYNTEGLQDDLTEPEEGVEEQVALLREEVDRLADARQAGGALKPTKRTGLTKAQETALSEIVRCNECGGRHREKTCPNKEARKDSRYDGSTGVKCNWRDPKCPALVCSGAGHLNRHHLQMSAEAARTLVQY